MSGENDWVFNDKPVSSEKGVVLVKPPLRPVDDGTKNTVDVEILDVELLGESWYPDLRQDLREATRSLKVYVDPKAENKVKRSEEDINNDRLLILSAQKKLKDNEIAVDLILDRESKKKVVDAVRLVFDEVDEEKIGNRMTKQDAEKLLNEMNIDVLKVQEENKKKKAEADRSREVPPEPRDPAEPRPPEEPSPEAGRNRETVGDYVKENEVSLNKYLLQEWDPLLSLHPDKPKLARLVELSKSMHKDRLMERFRAGDTTVYEDMFSVAQDVYLKEILNDGNYVKIAGNSESIKRQEKISKVVNQDSRNKFEGRLTEFVAKIFYDEKRRWFEYGADGEIMKENLEKFLINKFNKTEIVEDKSDYGVVVKILKEPYLSTDNIGLNINSKIDKEPKADLIRQMIKVHDITVMMDNPTYKPESARAELLQSIDGALVSMLSIRKGRTLIVPKVMELYDTVMRETYRDTKKEIDIDSKDLHDEVFRRVRHEFVTDEEANLFIKMGRDVCRITGVDAQYGYPMEVFPKDRSGLSATTKGLFLRGILNFNKALVSYDTDKRLVGGVNLGVVPFWNKLRDDENIGGRKAKEINESIPLTESIIERLILGKMTDGSENFLGWFGTLKGYSEAKKAESEFFLNPTFDNFVTKVIPGYAYLNFTPDKGKGYYQQRLENCVQYFLNDGEGEDALVASISKTFFSPEGKFDGKGIFDNYKEMKKFFTKKRGNFYTNRKVDADKFSKMDRINDSTKITDWINKWVPWA